MLVLVETIVFLCLSSKISCAKNADIFSERKNLNLPTSQMVSYSIRGAEITFPNIPLEDEICNLQLKCIIHPPGPDGSNVTEVEPFVTNDTKKVICRLPSDISTGEVRVDLEVQNKNETMVRENNTRVYTINGIVLPSPSEDLQVEESLRNWDLEVHLTWNAAYFRDFFVPGSPILLEMGIYISDNGKPEFIDTSVREIVGLNDLGAQWVTLSDSNIEKIKDFRFPYFYIVRPAASGSDIYLSSRLITPTLEIHEPTPQDICANWLASAASVPAGVKPCPNCLCKAKNDRDFIEAEFDPQIVELGRIWYHQLYYQRVPTGNGHAQTCSYNIATKALTTNSPAEAGWVHYVSKDISYVENYLSDIWPYIVCCLQAGGQYCQEFHEKRPVDTGHDYEGADEPCQGAGDPHMITFDGVYYDFQGFGEFWLIRGTENGTFNFGAQGRMSPLVEGQKVTYFKAVAIREGNTTVQVMIGIQNRLQIILNNATQLLIPREPTTIPLGNISIFIDGSFVEVRAATGFTIKILHLSDQFAVYGYGAQKNKGKGYMGLFGNFDGNKNNDLTFSNGRVIPPTANLQQVHDFGMSWMTNENNSFFTYEDGLDWFDYANPGFQTIIVRPDPEDLPEEVRLICQDNLACYYEYVGTDGDLEMANKTIQLQIEIDKLREELAEEIRMCDVLESPPNGTVHVEGYLNGSIARYSCHVGYELSGEMYRGCFDLGDNLAWNGTQPTCIWTCSWCPWNDDYKLYHDPSDCTMFFLCTFGQRYHLQCPLGQNFNRDTLICDEDYECYGQPGC